MKIENIKIYNFEGAFRGMRNPMNSWPLSDSYFGMINTNCIHEIDTVAGQWCKSEGLSPLNFEEWDIQERKYSTWLRDNGLLDIDDEQKCAVAAFIGPKDMHLAQKLIQSGPEHRKFLRQIIVSVDITAPIYWWKEFDTYKVGTVANSTSTMHKLTSTPITMECFEIDDYDEDLYVPRVDQSDLTEFAKETGYEDHWHVGMLWDYLIESLEDLRQAIDAETDPVNRKALWKELVRILPQGWLQTRTITFNYENLYAIAHQRSSHKLTEWSEHFMSFIKSLPYANELIYLNNPR